MSNFGHDRERKLVALLREDGWFAMRAPASLGVADVIALKAGEQARMIEVKATAAGPYHGFSPADRVKLAGEATKAGAAAYLVHWPRRKKPKWIPADEWP